MNNYIVRVDEDYRKLSEAFMDLGYILDKMFPDRVGDVKVVLPRNMHVALFGVTKGFNEVRVEGPFGHYQIECGK
jgi:hypothetical protein